ncbi:MAG: kynureninase [Pseudomonadales bacterium]|nr:kynureninase [Pseudomonadales bacterium]MBO6597119.1 kynureninase [Pseudomonadales bacterium]MBO6823694.1 kynureninase [Pseudomonadales bacterium]
MNLETCIKLDRRDELADLKNRFIIPEDVIYLDGNSLGPLLAIVKERVNDTVNREWGTDLITSWNKNDWINLPVTVGEKIAKLIGAAPGQVLCADSVSVNLFKVLAAALTLRPERNVVLSSDDNFPTDLYMAQGLTKLRGNDYELRVVDPEEVLAQLSDSVAVLMLTEVNFKSGKRWDMKAVNTAAHAAGVLVIWDLSHSIGAVPVELDHCMTDFAVGCGYKYLNGGPGAPAFVYVAERHQEVQQPLSGWMGHVRPFDFRQDYEPADGIRRFSSGTPGIIGMSALDAAMNIWEEIDVVSVQQKSESLATVIRERLRHEAAFSNLELFGPGPGPEGGSQISMRHPNAYGIVQAMIERGVIGDFRAPNIVRFGLCPLFLSHVDVYNAMNRMAEVIKSKAYEDPRFSSRAFVT